MEEDKRKSPYPYPEPDQAEPLAKRIAALQEKAGQFGFDQTQIVAELKAFMDDGWGKGEKRNSQASRRCCPWLPLSAHLCR